MSLRGTLSKVNYYNKKINKHSSYNKKNKKSNIDDLIRLGKIRNNKVGKKCPRCGGALMKRKGKNGTFIGCINYPRCKYTAPMSSLNKTKTKNRTNTTPIYPNVTKKPVNKSRTKKIGEKCPKCGHDLVIRKGSFGEFIGCSNYPKCKYTAPISSLNKK